MYPRFLYEALPVFYVVAGGLCAKFLPSPLAWLPAGAFLSAALLVIIQRWYYRRQLSDSG